MSPLLRENGRTPAAFVGDINSLLWNFIQSLFFTEFSSLSYPHSITLYILNKRLIKQLFPDPRRRRPRFEFPGSAGAGPRQQGSLIVKDREAWHAAVHGSQRVGHDLTNDHHHQLI